MRIIDVLAGANPKNEIRNPKQNRNPNKKRALHKNTKAQSK
jgi:hypothetical protein